MSELKIMTDFVYPPIPIRDKDWRAYIDGEEETGRCRWGKTEEAAVLDFVEQYAYIYWPGGQK